MRGARNFPPLWLAPVIPDSFSGDNWLASFAEALAESGCPIDVSSQPAVWGNALRNRPAVLAANGSFDLERAVDRKHACDLVEARIIEILCGISREQLDVFFLPVRHAYADFQIEGAFEALESARQEGHIGHFGLRCVSDPTVCMALWGLHNAFELIVLPNQKECVDLLVPYALQRGVNVVIEEGTAKEHARLLRVSSPERIIEAAA